MKVSNNSEQNYSEIVTNDHDKEIPNDRWKKGKKLLMNWD